MSPAYVEVAIYQAPVRKPFHYAVPEGIVVQLGQLVEVSFRTGLSQGIIVALSETSPVAHPKPLHHLIIGEPVVTPTQIALAMWLAEQTLAPFGACLWLMLPTGLAKKGDTLFTLTDLAYSADPQTLVGQVVESLRSRGALRAAQLDRAFAREPWRERIQTLIASGIVTKHAVLAEPDAKAQTIRMVQLALQPEELTAAMQTLQRSPKQAAILAYLAEHPESIPAKDLLAATEASPVSLRQLADKGYLHLDDAEFIRDSLAGRSFVGSPPPELTVTQAAVWQTILTQLRLWNTAEATSHSFLLHGVTGSGKTEIYLRALAEVLAQGRQAIVLVPEISLVPQQVQRFASRFPDQVSVIHSALSEGEQYDTWRRIRDGQTNVVVGARSALFAPLRDVGLVIIDEEHDDSYKQSPPIPPPYYHAREVAIQMMRITGGTVILGSATPTVNTYQRASRGELTLLSLPQRVTLVHQPTDGQTMTAGLPPVEVVDMRHELRAGNRTMFSRSLHAALSATLAREEQAILFLNRRGNASFVLCRDCGYVARCPNCEMTLTYHAANTQLICHSCGHHSPQLTVCPQCSGTRIRYFGAGTASVAEALRADFPTARVLRWDRDTTQQHGAHEELLEQFAAGNADILVGTQMIVKGLDLPRVTLVGAVLADTALGLPDYRAGERTFQLLTQAAGRAGRAALAGRVVFQTYQPEHYAIAAASQHDYLAFYEQEIGYRRLLRFPPYTRLVRLIFRHDSPAKAQQEAEQAATLLRQRIAERGAKDADLIGPAPTFFGRVDNIFSWHILLRAADPLRLLHDWTLRAGSTLDVDPLDIL